MEKVLSIIIPTYNMEKYLQHCLDSLIVPNMDEVEVLVINDGSKDASSAIAHRYQNKYPKSFRVIDKENGNYGSCINRGLHEATGKYIKVLDADDSFNSKSFNEYIKILSAIDTDLVLNDHQIVDENGNNRKYNNISGAIPYEVFSFTRHPVFPSMHGVAYKTENLKSIGYHQTEGISYTDQEWIYWPMSTVKTAYYIPKPLYRYLIGREGQTMDPKVISKALPQELKILERMASLWEMYHDKWKESLMYMETKLKTWEYLIFNKAVRYGDREEKKMFQSFDSKLVYKYPSYYQLSKTFLLGEKLRFPYLWYWRKFNTVVPFNFLFILKEKYNN